ncbi:MAG: PaaI family thioesterase [Pseudomonadota bacterium]
MTDPTYARIKASFERQNLMQTFGATLTSVGNGAVEITAPIGENVKQQQGFAHAGLTFALGDTAAGYAALSVMPLDNEVVTAELKINLLAPGIGAHLIARGRVLKPGRRLVVVASDVFAIHAGTETHIAALQGTMVPVPKSL